jgi:hypothetical protein
MATHAIAMIARGVRSFWLGSLATLRSEASPAAPSRGGTGAPTASRKAAGPGYSFKYTNGLQTIQDTQGREFSTERAARREALRTAREMANNVSWRSSARDGAGWTVLVIDPMGQQVCEVPVRLKNDGFDFRT